MQADVAARSVMEEAKRRRARRLVAPALFAAGALFFAAACTSEGAMVWAQGAIARLLGPAGTPAGSGLAHFLVRELRDFLVIAPAFGFTAAGAAALLGRPGWKAIAGWIETVGERKLAIAICLLAAVATVAISGGILGWNIVNPDAASHVFQAFTFASGNLWVSAPDPAEAFETIEVVTAQGRMVSKYPPGTALAFLPGALIGSPWIVLPVIALANTYLVYVTGRRLYGPRTALWAAAFMALSPFFLFNSAAPLSHAPCLLFVSLAVLLTVDMVKHGATPGRAALAGLAIGAAMLTRPLSGLAVAVPVAAALILSRRFNLKAAAAGGLAVAACLLVYAGYQWLAFGTVNIGGYGDYWPHDRLGFGKVGIGIDDGPHYFTNYGPAQAVDNSWQRVKMLSFWLFGWPISSLLLIVPPFLRRNPRRADLFLAAIPASLMLAYVFYWFEGSNEAGPSYLVTAAGALVLLSAKGLSDVHEWLARFRTGAELSLGVGVAVILMFAASILVFVPYVSRATALAASITGEPEQMLREAGVESGVVFVSHRSCHTGVKGLGFPHPGTANDPLLRRRLIFALDRGSATNHEVLRRHRRGQAYRLLCATVPSRLLGTEHYHRAALMPFSEDVPARDARDEAKAATSVPLPRSRAFEVLYSAPPYTRGLE